MGTGRLFACSLVRHKTDGHRYQVQQPHYITWRYHRYNTEFLVKDTGTILCTWKYNIMVHASSNSRCLLTAQNKRQLHNRNSGRKTLFGCLREGLPLLSQLFRKRTNVQSSYAGPKLLIFGSAKYIAN